MKKDVMKAYKINKSTSNKTWSANILTLYPEIFPGALKYGVVGNSLKKRIWSMNLIDIKNFALGKHRNVDDRPIGGGPGMILRSDVIDAAIKTVEPHISDESPFIYLTPKGQLFTQEIAEAFSKTSGMNILCGRFGGVDERVIQHYKPIEISIGDFILSGAEVAAQVLIDSIVRLLPGTLGNIDSTFKESFSQNLLEHPQYTKPNVWNNTDVPKVLLSGNHKAIEFWRLEQSKRITKERRSDLWQKYLNSDIEARKLKK